MRRRAAALAAWVGLCLTGSAWGQDSVTPFAALKPFTNPGSANQQAISTSDVAAPVSQPKIKPPSAPSMFNLRNMLARIGLSRSPNVKPLMPTDELPSNPFGGSPFKPVAPIPGD